MNVTSKHTYISTFLLALTLPFASCSSSSSGGDASAVGGRGGRGGRGANGAVPVVSARAVRKAMPITVPAVGTVEAISSVQIRSQVTGQLTAVHFAEGQEVRQGQPVFSLDPRPFPAALQQAPAVLARDTATLVNAETAEKRADALVQRGLIPKDQYDTQHASTAALRATVEADTAAIETARLNLQYAEIAAPITGQTGSLGAHAGDLVRANDSTPLVVINQLAPVYVTFSVPGRFLNDIRRYQAVRPLAVTAVAAVTGSAATPGGAPQADGAAVTPSAGAGANARAHRPSPPARGVVTFIDNAVDAATAMIRLKGTFPNGDYGLWPGSFVQVTLDLTTEEDAVVVPATAVQASQDGQYVFVIKPDRTVEMRVVRVGRQQGDEAVIAEGLAPDEEVVTDGQLRLTPGARVAAAGDPAGRAASPAGRSR